MSAIAEMRHTVIHRIKREIEFRTHTPVSPAQVQALRDGTFKLGPCGLCGAMLRGWMKDVEAVDVCGLRTLVCARGDCAAKRKWGYST